jgi:predicted transcriptional regulator YheO
MSSRKHSVEQQVLLRQVKEVARGLGATLAPFCEVVVHDLRHPKNAIAAIENNLSGRRVGDPATELGLARLADENYPQVLANYPNRFADGRQVKSTSIGIKDSSGAYVAALCLNIDLSLFHGLQHALTQFSKLEGEAGPEESLDPANASAIRARIDEFAARRATTPRTLSKEDRRQLMRELKDAGVMELRRSADIVARHLGVSRATIYNDGK